MLPENPGTVKEFHSVNEWASWSYIANEADFVCLQTSIFLQ